MLTTEQLAEKLHVKPNTIRSALCRTGSYMGIRPTKLPNRFLAWPDDAVERLVAQPQSSTESQQA
ncbi:hypothetical protein [Marinobacter sp. KMM 10035]|uniref:hypothetical protein n=1 Tax=Marinobacter sp. KMM 10035 TaxID=3134034 RepID=UPI00397CA21F